MTPDLIQALLLPHVKEPLKYAVAGITAKTGEPAKTPRQTGETLARELARLHTDGLYLARQRSSLDSHLKNVKLVYSATEKGRDRIREDNPKAAELMRVPSRNTTFRQIPHTLAITKFMVTWRRAADLSPAISELAFDYSTLLIRDVKLPNGEKRHLRSDATLTLTLATGRTEPLYFEADMSTEYGDAFFAKLYLYDEFFTKSAAGGRVIIATKSHLRRDNVRTKAQGMRNKSAFYVVCQKDYDAFNPLSILEPIFVTGKYPEQRPLL